MILFVIGHGCPSDTCNAKPSPLSGIMSDGIYEWMQQVSSSRHTTWVDWILNAIGYLVCALDCKYFTS